MDIQEFDQIKQAQSGDTNAFNNLVRIHDRPVFQAIYGMLGNLHDTQDIYQETFLRAFTAIQSFRFESEFRTWLMRIAINLCINFRKRRKLKNRLFPDNENHIIEYEISPNVHSEPDPEDSVLTREFYEILERGLEVLSAQQRAVFVLKHFQGYKIKEISKMFKCTEGTVKSQLFRATNKLQKVLTPYLT